MKLNKKILKTFTFAMFFALIVTFFLPLEAHSSKSNVNIEMEVKAGYDGVARLGAYVPFKVLLINKGRAVEGQLQIEVKIDSQSKTAFSKPVSLAEGAVKEVVISAPVFTARRGVQLKFLEDKKVIKETEYTFTKLIHPDIKTIGVLSQDNAAYSFLNGAKLPQSNNGIYDEKIKVMQAAGIYPSTSRAIAVEVGADTINKVESILIPLTAEDLPEDMKAMVGFDTLIVSNFDTSTLSAKQLDTLEKWVEDGGTLVVGTGVSWKKTYGPLPEALKKFSISGTESVDSPSELEKFAGISISDSVSLNIVKGDIGFDYKKEKTESEDNTVLSNNQEKEKEESQELKAGELNKGELIYSAYENEVIIGDNIRP
ncbi:MAG: hypothetical protein GX957_16075, partial [Clostridiaceae bacterium]|nr:hypothetical protein [Clostridiaceae bacterium]